MSRRKIIRRTRRKKNKMKKERKRKRKKKKKEKKTSDDSRGLGDGEATRRNADIIILVIMCWNEVDASLVVRRGSRFFQARG